MAVPTNILQNVQTYNKASLAYLLNSCPFLKTANKKYQDFQKANPANLGDTITFDKPPRFIAGDGLVANFQGVEQRVQTLTVNKAKNVPIAVTAQELIFNVEDYMDRFGKAAVQELASVIEADIAQLAVTAPYRHYGDGITPITSHEQLSQMLAEFRNFGAARDNTRVYLSDVAIPSIVNSGLNQFVPGRNDEEANSWELNNTWNKAEWYSSNLLPTHTAGTEGVQQATLTVVSTTTNSDGGVTSITFSGTTSASDAASVKENDKFTFQDDVSGQPDLRFRTFIGHHVSANQVQFRATADAASTGGSQVTVTIEPALQAPVGKNQNINTAIVAGMQVKALPSHRAGLVHSGDQFYVAMPPLPDQRPYDTSVHMDDQTGASLRFYSGSLFGQNQTGSVTDCIWGDTLVSDNAMSVIFPL